MSSTTMNDRATEEAQVSYGDRPSRAWLRSEHQFVLLKAQVGAIRPDYIVLAREILADATRLERQVHAGHGEGEARQDLKLRGICFDPRHASLVMHLELLHDKQLPAALAEEEICAAFSHAKHHYGGQFGMVDVVMTTEKQHVAYHDPLSDHFYEDVRRVLDW